MIITKRSAATRKIHTRDIPIKDEDYLKWEAGTLIQDAAPYLSSDDRAFLISGVTPEEWEALFKDSE